MIAKNETIINKKILILREQGIGEEILFSSMYKELINLNQNIQIETDRRLIDIFERSFESKKFVPDGYYSTNKEELNKFDSIIYAGSLCSYFRKNKNDFLQKSYLVDNIRKTLEIKQDPIFVKKDLKIGLSWKSVVSVYGKLKSLNLFDFKPLIKKTGSLSIYNMVRLMKKLTKKKTRISIFTLLIKSIYLMI